MAPRLPAPGSDDGVWGDILNDFLLQAHNSDGTLRQLSQSQILNLTADLAARVRTTDLSAVATTGSYVDLTNKPAIPNPATLVANADLDAKTAALISQNLSSIAASLTAFNEAMSVMGRTLPGRYIAPPPMVATTVITLDSAANRPSGAWLPIWTKTSIDRIGVEVTTAGPSGAAISLALYKLRTTASTLDFVISTPALDATTIGFKEAVVTATLPAGRYALFAAQMAGATADCQLRASNGSPLFEAAEQAEIADRRGGIHVNQLGGNVFIPTVNSWPLSLPLVPGSRGFAPACYLRTA
jgi:hypothetical protein